MPLFYRYRFLAITGNKSSNSEQCNSFFQRIHFNTYKVSLNMLPNKLVKKYLFLSVIIDEAKVRQIFYHYQLKFYGKSDDHMYNLLSVFIIFGVSNSLGYTSDCTIS